MCVCVCFLVNNKGKKWINSSHEKLCLRHSQKSQAILIRRRQQNENEGTEMQAQIQISPMSLILRFRLNQVAVLKALKLKKGGHIDFSPFVCDIGMEDDMMFDFRS